MKYLKIHTLKKGEWYDKDIILLHAAFQLLVDFIEQEKPDEICDWQYDEAHRNAWSEITALYKWWTEERPNRKDPLDEVSAPPEEEYQTTKEGYLIFPSPEKYPAYYAALDSSSKLEQEKTKTKKVSKWIDRFAGRILW